MTMAFVNFIHKYQRHNVRTSVTQFTLLSSVVLINSLKCRTNGIFLNVILNRFHVFREETVCRQCLLCITLPKNNTRSVQFIT